MSIPIDRIRNFVITAHIDHGKSTLADRLLEVTGTVAKRDLQEQTLDQMDLERERGITIKLAPVRMRWTVHRPSDRDPAGSGEYVLHLIDTPGHVDFTYEVSRSLAAVEGAVLLVDATQGVQAQTIANLYLALGEDLTIIPVVNKIDLPNADVERTRRELIDLLGCAPEDVLLVSGKTGEGVRALLDAIIERVPSPVARAGGSRREGTRGATPLSGPSASEHAGRASVLEEGVRSERRLSAGESLRALIFDSTYDDYRGVIAYVRIMDGGVRSGDRLHLMATNGDAEALEVGTFTPKLAALPELGAGEIGYVVTGLKDIRAVRVGDTVTSRDRPAAGALAGYAEVKPMVYAGLFPRHAEDTERLREAIARLRLNDASLAYEPEHSAALGFGFRCGFLGLLHLEIVQERLRREHGIEVTVTVPSVAYHVIGTTARRQGGQTLMIRSPQELPDPSHIERIDEPWVHMDIVTPEAYVGGLMQLGQERRGAYITTEYLAGGADGNRRAILKYEFPLQVVLVDFYDRLKGISQGYASMNYEIIGYRQAEVRRLDILVAGEVADALASIVYEDEATRVGRRIVEQLKEAIPKQQFEIRLQAALGGKIVASERIAPLRKDVLKKMSGGDVTRKMKLLQKQKKGKQAMRTSGHVELPPSAYLAVLKRG